MKQSVRTLFLLALLPLVSCAQKERDGGPCSYQTTYYPATIILIFEVDSDYSDMIVVTSLYGEMDTVMFHAESYEYFSKKEMKEMNYKAGDTLTYEVKEIIDGSCSPYLTRLTKERYKPKP